MDPPFGGGGEEMARKRTRKPRPRPRPLPLPPKPCKNPNECSQYQADLFKPGECAFCFQGYCLADRKEIK